MRNKIILLLFAAGFGITSCNTSYKNTQTPDDVYYSPLKVRDNSEESVKKEKILDPEEREIRMAAHDPRWRNLDVHYHYDHYYNPYYYGYASGYGYYYNPYYYPYPVYAPIKWTTPQNSTPRMVNLAAYQQPSTILVKNPKLGTTQTIRNNTRYNNSNTNSTTTRSVFSSGSSSDTRDNGTRTYSPSSSGGSRGVGSGSTPVSRPPRN